MPNWRPIRRLGDSLSDSLSRLGLEQRIKQYAIFTVWPTVVGPQLAGQAHPQRFANGKLIVHVTNSLWLYQMTMMRPRLLAALRAAIAPGELREIVLRVGPIARTVPPASTGPEPTKPERLLTPEQVGEIERYLDQLGEAPFREALRRLWITSLECPPTPPPGEIRLAEMHSGRRASRRPLELSSEPGRLFLGRNDGLRERFPKPEPDNLLGRNLDAGTGRGVPTHARLAVNFPEPAEPWDDGQPPGPRLLRRQAKGGRQAGLNLPLWKTGFLRDPGDELGFSESLSSSSWHRTTSRLRVGRDQAAPRYRRIVCAQQQIGQ